MVGVIGWVEVGEEGGDKDGERDGGKGKGSVDDGK